MKIDSQEVALRIWEGNISRKLTVVGECWLVAGSHNGNGYVPIRARPYRAYAHRITFIAFNGPVPDGLFVLHTCDVRRCCRPQHLFLGTQADNIADMDAKGRRGVWHPRGETNPAARLTAEKAAAIRVTAGLLKNIAAEYGVSESLVSQIKRGEAWA